MRSEKIYSKNAEARQMMDNMEALALNYWRLGAKTKRVVRDIQGYGEDLKVM
jgi:hypothetical protein